MKLGHQHGQLHIKGLPVLGAARILLLLCLDS